METTCGQVLCGKAKEEWLKTFLELPNGIPSHDTFRRIFSQLEPEILEQNFQEWIKVTVGELGLKVVAIDWRSSKLFIMLWVEICFDVNCDIRLYITSLYGANAPSSHSVRLVKQCFAFSISAISSVEECWFLH